MADVLVSCIRRVAHYNAHEGITHLGGPGGGGWLLTREQVIANIESRTNTFFTLAADGKRADIGVVDGLTGKYVRTYADKEWSDNLLNLAQCP
jgi:hypothetical protein